MPKGVNSLCWLYHPGKVGAHFWTECQAEFVAMVTAIQQVIHDVISCQGVAYSLKVIEIEIIMEQYLCATPVILEVLYICTWASMHCCQNMDFSMSLFTFYIHSCEGTYPWKFCMHSYMSCSVEFREVDIVAGIPQQPYHFYCRNSMWDACWHVHHFDHPLQPQPLLKIAC